MAEDGRRIEQLERMEKMMTTAYDAALGKVNDERLVETMGALREHHRQCVQSLQGISQQSSGQGTQLDGTFNRFTEEVLDTIDGAVRRDEAIGELRIAEAALRMSYGQALQDIGDRQLADQVKVCMTSEAEHAGVLAMAHRSART